MVLLKVVLSDTRIYVLLIDPSDSQEFKRCLHNLTINNQHFRLRKTRVWENACFRDYSLQASSFPYPRQAWRCVVGETGFGSSFPVTHLLGCGFGRLARPTKTILPRPSSPQGKHQRWVEVPIPFSTPTVHIFGKGR